MDGGSGEMAKEKLNKSFRKYKKKLYSNDFSLSFANSAYSSPCTETGDDVIDFPFLFHSFPFSLSHQRHEAELSARGREALKVKLWFFLIQVLIKVKTFFCC